VHEIIRRHIEPKKIYEIGWATKTLASDGFPEAMKFLAARLGCSPGSSQR